MAATALDVLPLATAKVQLRERAQSDFDSDDEILSQHIAAAVAHVERETGIALVDQQVGLQCWPPAPGEPLCTYGERFISDVRAVRYWTKSAHIRDEPDGTLAPADLGRVHIDPERLVIYPPVTGWPMYLDGSWFTVDVTFGIDVALYPNIRQAVVLVVRELLAGRGAMVPAVVRAVNWLIDPLRSQLPARRLLP